MCANRWPRRAHRLLGIQRSNLSVYNIFFVLFRKGHPGVRNRARPTRARLVGKLQIIGLPTDRPPGDTRTSSPAAGFRRWFYESFVPSALSTNQQKKEKKIIKHPPRFNLTSLSFSSRLTPNRIPFRALLFFSQYFFAGNPSFPENKLRTNKFPRICFAFNTILEHHLQVFAF